MDYEEFTRYLDLRSELKRMCSEFQRCVDAGERVNHQLLNALGHSPAPTQKAWAAFIQANEGSALADDEWEQWEAFPDGRYCSRFCGYGSKSSVALFKAIGGAAYRILEALADEAEGGIAIPNGVKLNLPRAELDGGLRPSLGYVGWLTVVYETGRACPTSLLRVDDDLFWGDPEFSIDQFEEMAERFTTAGDGTQYPTYPLVELLAADLFQSSVDAIGVWLYPAEYVRVHSWEADLPVHLPDVWEPSEDDVDQDDEDEAATTTSELEAADSRDAEEVKPYWNEVERQLWFGSTLLREYTSEPAESQTAILGAFQDQGWPRSIETPPIPGHEDPRRVAQAAYHINISLVEPLIHFRSFQNGNRILWEKGPRSTKKPKGSGS